MRRYNTIFRAEKWIVRQHRFLCNGIQTCARYFAKVKRVGKRGEGKFERISWDEAIDTAASKLASALHAKKLILLTDVPGLMKDPGNPDTLIRRLKVSQVPALVMSGIISGGMIPKVDCCVEAVRQGVERANIQDGRLPHSILIELLSDDGIGTMFS